MLEIDLATQKAVVHRVLSTRGVLRALALLNDRAAYRYSGIYKLSGNAMRAVHIFDRHAEYRAWPMVLPLSRSFCQFVMQQGERVISHASTDRRFALLPHASLVESYYGQLLTHECGTPYGAFIHFDVETRTIAAREISFLHEVVPHFLPYLD
ncbi:hypothetical protein [Ottowia sp.]|jgi:hypothetical protein|uniref:hypothetical protein n=1 Tax=Ottowia sp. TaxID=1898956 RepID=UPI0025E192A6|nr:hypothetical protein [Ottowia sp.]MBK6614764.1 hypothetical protein [Ottowia sp.]MBK6745849.1 hypothetical protein [Ottowia sp.]